MKCSFPVLSLLASLLLIGGCKDDSAANAPATAAPAANTVKIIFTYGSEKEAWVKQATQRFNALQKKVGDKVIVVEAIATGSGDCVDEVLTGRRKAHLISPASQAFIDIGNAQSKAMTGKDLVQRPTSIVMSPVVIAMWKPMAESLGYGQKQIGWRDIIAVSTDQKGWETYGHKEWGAFKFGHTHPEFSNSGMISVLAEAYAGAGKTAGLKMDDVSKSETQQFIGTIERSVVHYGSSTGFFAKKMFEQGPSYLSAAVMYESNVIESYSQVAPSQMPIVAIYPKEGTFWSDHPTAIVNKEWVKKEHQDAAKLFVEFLTSTEMQTLAMEYGFRPSDPSIALSAKFSLATGVDPKEPRTTLEVPTPQVLQSVVDVWKRNKKPSNVVLVFDTSGSMNDEGRIRLAKESAIQFVAMLHDNDRLSFVPFSSSPGWRFKSLEVGKSRQRIDQEINSVFASGGTALYDSTLEAVTYLRNNPMPGYITAVVVMTDGEDTDSNRATIDSLCQLLTAPSSESHEGGIRVFTVGYGSAARMDVLKRISKSTNAKEYQGTNENIRTVFKEIATFF